ncbi:MAG: hypothetical protein JWL69_3220 [Phycisphaerales bacterium]|nr:hypothetical protein [Phycisphaerales bacterium]
MRRRQLGEQLVVVDPFPPRRLRLDRQSAGDVGLGFHNGDGNFLRPMSDWDCARTWLHDRTNVMRTPIRMNRAVMDDFNG